MKNRVLISLVFLFCSVNSYTCGKNFWAKNYEEIGPEKNTYIDVDMEENIKSHIKTMKKESEHKDKNFLEKLKAESVILKEKLEKEKNKKLQN